MKPNHPVTRLIPGLAILLFALSHVSCQNTAKPPEPGTATPASGNHWVKVSSHPPTYYPRGVAADCPTDHFSGEWIHTGDSLNTRYFIPLHNLKGTPRDVLINEALAARSHRKLKEIASEDRDLFNNQLRQSVIYAPILVPLGVFGGGYGPTLEDLDRWHREWYSSKGIKR